MRPIGTTGRAGTVARNTLILAALRDATGALAAHRVRSLPLKGAALLASATVAPGARHLDDLDLWVPAAQARRAWDVLVDAGFRPGPRASARHGGGDALDEPTHQLPILRSPHGALVELHLESHASGDAGDFDACFAAGDDVDVFGVAVRVPGALHLLEQLCAHVVLHHFGELKYWPRHVDDVRALVARAPALAALAHRPDEVGLSVRVAHGTVDAGSADAWLTRLLVGPGPRVQRAWTLLAVAVRAGRFAWRDPRGLARVVVPHERHLVFTGDLQPGRSRLAAHAARWRRIAARSWS